MSTTRRATSRVHKGGGVPGARRVGGSAGATREIHELKTKIQELSDDNKALKVKELTPQKKDTTHIQMRLHSAPCQRHGFFELCNTTKPCDPTHTNGYTA